MDLAPFAIEEVAALVEAVVAGPAAREVALRLHRLSLGNPLHLRALVEAALDQGALREQNGVWRLVGVFDAPSSVQEVFGARLRQIAPEAREVLDLLACAGWLGRSTLDRLVQPGAIDAADDMGLLLNRRDGDRRSVQLTHPLLTEVVRSELSAGNTARTFARLADALEADGLRRPGDTSRLALWRIEAGEDAYADLPNAIDLNSPVIRQPEILARIVRSSPDAHDVRRLLARALSDRGQIADAEAVLREAVAVATEPLDVIEAIDQLAECLASSARVHEALALLDQVETRFAADPLAQTHLTLARCRIQMISGALAAGVATALAIVATTPPEIAFFARVMAAEALPNIGRANEVAALVDANVAFYDELASRGVTVNFPRQLFTAQYIGPRIAVGELKAAEADAHAMYDECVAADFGTGIRETLLRLGTVQLLTGRAESALRNFREAHAAALTPSQRLHALGGVAACLAALGREGEAIVVRDELDAIATDHPPSPAVAVIPSGRAAALHIAGRTSAAIDVLDRATAIATDNGLAAVEAELRHDLVRLGAEHQATRLAALAAQCDGPLVAEYASHAHAREANDADQLLAAARGFTSLGLDLYAAEAALAAVGAAGGSGRVANAATRLAQEALSRCEGARPITTVVGPVPARLTRREAEIAGLAARGLSDQDIADELVVSRRTIESHLQRAYTKLGVNSRAELRDALG